MYEPFCFHFIGICVWKYHIVVMREQKKKIVEGDVYLGRHLERPVTLDYFLAFYLYLRLLTQRTETKPRRLSS